MGDSDVKDVLCLGNPFIPWPDFLHEGSFLLIFHIDVKLNAKTHFNSYDSSKPLNTQKFVTEISADFLNRGHVV